MSEGFIFDISEGLMWFIIDDVFLSWIPQSVIDASPEEALEQIHELSANIRCDANAMVILWGTIIALAVLTIWSRAVGPRFRIDQLNDITWKDLLPFLIGFLLLVVAGVI